MAEETQSAGRAGEYTFEDSHERKYVYSFFVAPKGIVGTCICSAVVGIVYLLALLFAIPNVATFIEERSKDNDMINLAVATYQLAVPHRGALALTILLVLNLHFGGMSGMTVTSRIG